MLVEKRIYKSELKVLYVGKTCSGLQGRMVAHLGYDKKNDSHGLQLCHWAVYQHYCRAGTGIKRTIDLKNK